MSQNIGTLITAAIRPNDSLDLIASAFQNEIKGGHHAYATLAEKDAIIEARRDWGMFTSVYNDGVNNGIYQLEYNLVDTDINNNSNWSIFSGGTGTGGTDTFSGLTDTIVITPTNGDLLIYSGNNVTNVSEKDIYFTASTSGQTIFNVLSVPPVNNDKTKFYVNGVKQLYNSDYTITGGTNVVWITSKHSLELGDDLEITYL